VEKGQEKIKALWALEGRENTTLAKLGQFVFRNQFLALSKP
jgi:hypothetical protein